jgi:hypothetical protein
LQQTVCMEQMLWMVDSKCFQLMISWIARDRNRSRKHSMLKYHMVYNALNISILERAVMS